MVSSRGLKDLISIEKNKPLLIPFSIRKLNIIGISSSFRDLINPER